MKFKNHNLKQKSSALKMPTHYCFHRCPRLCQHHSILRYRSLQLPFFSWMEIVHKERFMESKILRWLLDACFGCDLVMHMS